ncbi:MAG TPA: DUF3368 domain-containing protein [Rhizomicrobium sp.]|nr:DUF3368 domain-containing protein [Rhizomicrobium sp.]
MPIVVADTGPVHYLVLTGDVALLPALFDKVIIPQAVCDELADPGAPLLVRQWIRSPSSWLETRRDPPIDELGLAAPSLDRGERAAIALGLALRADLVLIDERDGAAFARRRGLAVTGTLGILDLAARRGLVDLAGAFERLKATSFYYRQGLLDELLAREKKRTRD